MFTHNGFRSLTRVAATLLLVLGLCASGAVADSQTAIVPSGPVFGLNVVLVPGQQGNGEVMASGGDHDDDVVYSIRFDTTGAIRVNGHSIGWAVLTESYTVSTNCRQTSAGWVADTMIWHTASGVVMASDTGRDIGADYATRITASGSSIASLTVG